ncbi:hypothetical protein ATANTOWER_007027 [Ataeniobius toweri]|uniref:Uncharacterized protein n=1 Tax=Ataeniobius toweri TaxID=208326 RepID=A0ABU7BLX9_9TELE|nr:hypothetical protein [Ataeniobius toweri]
MSHFIRFIKAERANNRHLSRKAKPPHVLHISRTKRGEPPASDSEGPHGHKESIMLHVYPGPAPHCGVCKDLARPGRALAHGAQDTLLNPISVCTERASYCQSL